ncbi:hypothetical protein NKH18_13620 [Streptomyces sp. M10(2022)]
MVTEFLQAVRAATAPHRAVRPARCIGGAYEGEPGGADSGRAAI